MIINYPIAAVVGHVPRGMKKEQYQIVITDTPLFVPDVEAEDVTPTFWWTPPAAGQECQLMVVEYQGKLWQPCIPRITEGEIIEFSTKENEKSFYRKLKNTKKNNNVDFSKNILGKNINFLITKDSIDHINHNKNFIFSYDEKRGVLDAIERKDKEYIPLDDLVLASKSIDFSKLEAQKDKMESIFCNMINIDGILFNQIKQPLLVMNGLETGYIKCHTGYLSDSNNIIDNHGNRDINVFSVCDVDMMTSYMKNLEKTKSKRYSTLLANIPKIDILNTNYEFQKTEYLSVKVAAAILLEDFLSESKRKGRLYGSNIDLFDKELLFDIIDLKDSLNNKFSEENTKEIILNIRNRIENIGILNSTYEKTNIWLNQDLFINEIANKSKIKRGRYEN